MVVALALVVVACGAVVVHAAAAAPYGRLTLPAFPLPPQHDLAMLGMQQPSQSDALVVVDEADADTEEVMALPRFRGGAAFASTQADAEADSEEEQAEAEAEAEGAAEEEESDEIVAQTVADIAETEQQEQEAAEADEEAEAEEEEQPQPQPRFVQPQQQPMMRFARALQRRYDANTLPAGPLPIPASTLQYDLAHAPVQAFGDALPMPLHHSERQFLNAQPVASLAANPNAYAWAGARLQPQYVYGNTLLGAPVNAQFYAPQPAAPMMQPLQPLQPMPAPVAPAAPAAPEASFLQTAAAMAQAAPQWPASVPRPAAFLLPADLAI